MKQFTVPEMTFKGYSRSSAMLSFTRSPGLSTRDRKAGNTYFQTKLLKLHWRRIKVT